MATSDKSDKSDPLKPVLRDAEAELSRRLHDACVAESGGLADKSSEEIREIEDSLLAAAVAAGQTISLRRYMNERDAQGESGQAGERTADAGAGTPRADSSTPDIELPPGSKVREFRDSVGRNWRAWPVIPGLSRTGRPKQYLGDFQSGWICFESLDSPDRRRLPCAPSRLVETRDEELERLLLEAIAAPERKGLNRPKS
jgi:hypothetical protein